MNIKDIETTITELENGPTTYDSCQKLASLYVVRSNLSGVELDTTVTEYHDILPMYNKYVDTKRLYQMQKVSITEVNASMTQLCKEVKEFLLMLYNNTESASERGQIRDMIDAVREAM